MVIPRAFEVVRGVRAGHGIAVVAAHEIRIFLLAHAGSAFLVHAQAVEAVELDVEGLLRLVVAVLIEHDLQLLRIIAAEHRSLK